MSTSNVPDHDHLDICSCDTPSVDCRCCLALICTPSETSPSSVEWSSEDTGSAPFHHFKVENIEILRTLNASAMNKDAFELAISKGIQKFMQSHAIPGPPIDFIFSLLFQTRFMKGLALRGTYVVCAALSLMRRYWRGYTGGAVTRESELSFIAGIISYCVHQQH